MSPSERRALEAAAHHEAGHAVAAEYVTQLPAVIELTRHQRGADVWFRGRTLFIEPDVAEGRRLVSLAGPCAEAMYLSPHARGEDLRRHVWRCASTSDAGDYLFGVGERTLEPILLFVDQRRAAVAARAAIEIHRYLSSMNCRRGGGPVVTSPRKA